jgi:hypothetical protein
MSDRLVLDEQGVAVMVDKVFDDVPVVRAVRLVLTVKAAAVNDSPDATRMTSSPLMRASSGAWTDARKTGHRAPRGVRSARQTGNSALDGVIGRLFYVLHGQPGSLNDYSAQHWE